MLGKSKESRLSLGSVQSKVVKKSIRKLRVLSVVTKWAAEPRYLLFTYFLLIYLINSSLSLSSNTNPHTQIIDDGKAPIAPVVHSDDATLRG